MSETLYAQRGHENQKESPIRGVDGRNKNTGEIQETENRNHYRQNGGERGLEEWRNYRGRNARTKRKDSVLTCQR